MTSKYFVIRVKYLVDGTVDKGEIIDFDSREAAIAQYHVYVGTDMNDASLRGSMCTVLNSYGMEVMHDSWSRPIVPDVPSEEE